MTKKPEIDVQLLADMSRMDVTQAELEKLEKEIPDILAFVEAIQAVDVSGAEADTTIRNVTRPDTGAHEGGIYTERLIAAAPASEGNRILVKQVVSRGKASHAAKK